MNEQCGDGRIFVLRISLRSIEAVAVPRSVSVYASFMLRITRTTSASSRIARVTLITSTIPRPSLPPPPNEYIVSVLGYRFL